MLRDGFTYLLVLLGTVLAADVRAQDIGLPTDYVRWEAAAEPAAVGRGGEFDVRLSARIEPGWKMYAPDSPRPSFGAEITLDRLPPGFSQRGEIRQSRATEAHDPFFDETVRYYENEAAFAVRLGVDEVVSEGEHAVGGSVRFQICNDTICLPPYPVEFTARLRVSGASEGGAQVAPDLTGGRGEILGQSSRGTAGAGDLDAARSRGFWGFVLLAIGAGVAALLTPCVFPMIPLTVSYFTRHAENRAESIRMASVYGGSIVLTFTSLGVLTAIFVGAAGAQTIAANPWINLFIGTVFVVFALALLGLFELRLPSGLLNFFNRQSQERHGYVGVLFMGFTLTLVSFSCTAPFVGGLLAATASNEWAYPIVGMLIFSATFSLPFVGFALFPKGLQSLPRSGAWMNTVKVVLGFIELAAALKFLSNADLIWGWGVISRPLAIAVAVVIFFLAGLYLLGKLRLTHDPPTPSIGVFRLLAAIAFLGMSLYMLPGLLGTPLNGLDAYLPPRQASDISLLGAGAGPRSLPDDGLDWYEDVEEAFARARESEKPIFIDFTGYTCTNCRQMEANVFPNEVVASRLRNDFVLLRLFTDDRDQGPDLQRYQLRMTGTVALPTYAIVDPFSEKIVARKSGISRTKEFAAFLSDALTAFSHPARAA